MQKQGMVAHGCNPSIWEADTEGSEIQGNLHLHKQTQGQAGLCKILSQKQTNK